ncbi:MAG: cytidylate kinase family protein [Anaerostipes sp.]|nr:cytidylate kinase family protein [Anaerostipes sp.]MDD3746947.1 cytidylate kinase family protein [Anaerostipes sp.]
MKEKRSKAELTRRYLFFIVGLFVNSFGVSFVTKASLGTSPISSIPYTLSLGFAPTLGDFTLYMSIVLIVIQLVLLRRNFPKEYLLQIPVSFAFSYFIDMTMNILNYMNPSNYIAKVGLLFVGCAILGIGVFMEMVADVVMLPGESFVNAVSVTFHTDFGKTKVVFDSSMTIIAGMIGVILYHKLAGVREGTIFAAVVVGMIARYLKRKIGWVEDKLLICQANETQQVKEVKKQEGIVITISREFGSGGRMISKKIAKELGFAFHDEDITKEAARRTGLSDLVVKRKEQKIFSGILYDMIAQVYDQSEHQARQDQLFQVESDIIKEYANEGNCVIVGRCADDICRCYKNSYHIFLYADDDFKINEIMKREEVAKEIAKRHVKNINRMRGNHYKYYTGRHWHKMDNYDLCMNTEKISVQEMIAMIQHIIKKPLDNKTVK